ncbi:g1302 [Coccomyxa viridis]|uniref:G1302 protein n=1 Tax=Coccomyxa viridis TaxID=1274662 RepID=A0ABP1FPH7_9CHLO
MPGSASEAVLQGQQAFDKAEYDAALQLFSTAMTMRPSDDEARAALYNGACAKAKLKDWQGAADDVLRAVNDYKLKLEVAVKDPDLKALRDRREWLDAVEKARGGVSSSAYANARAESKSPFRLVRLLTFGGLGAGAGIGLFIIISRLITALRGGEGAPDLTETLLNLSINSAALAGFSFLFFRDLRGAEKDRLVVDREEQLGRLLVELDNDRVVPLANFRGSVRPVLLAGSQGYLNRALKASELFRTELRARGISVIPIALTSKDPGEKLAALKREFRAGKEEKSGGFGSAPSAKPSSAAKAQPRKEDKKWQLKAASLEEWEGWAEEQKRAAGVKGDDIYIQVQLDGSIRRSGVGVPPWDRWLDDIPTLDSVQTRFTDGIGSSK